MASDLTVFDVGGISRSDAGAGEMELGDLAAEVLDRLVVEDAGQLRSRRSTSS